jgi:hypothetical protein
MLMFFLRSSRFLAVMVLLFTTYYCISPAQAEFPDSDFNFSLQLEHSESSWQYTTTTLTSKSSKLGVQLEQFMSPRLSGTLYVGFLDLSQPANTLPAAQFSSGYYGGIELSLLLLDLSHLKLDLTGGYAYQDTEGKDGGTTVNFVWYDTYGQLGMSIPLSRQLWLRAAGGVLHSSGEQRVSGTGSQLLTFTEQQKEYYSAGLDYWLDGSGFIRLDWLGGNRDGFRISFHRDF